MTSENRKISLRWNLIVNKPRTTTATSAFEPTDPRSEFLYDEVGLLAATQNPDRMCPSTLSNLDSG
jgi:hypothetical protein